MRQCVWLASCWTLATKAAGLKNKVFFVGPQRIEYVVTSGMTSSPFMGQGVISLIELG